MKVPIISITGEKKKEIELPKCFEEQPIREDLIQKALEIERSSKRKAYGNFPEAGKQYSAGRLLRARRGYMSSYGKGISRVPRKIMSEKGERIHWVGAFAPGTVGGRPAHPPKAEKVWKRKINKKEKVKAFKSALSALASKRMPLIFEEKILEIKKAKELKNLIGKFCPTERIIFVSDKEIKAKGIGIKNTTVKNLELKDLVSGKTLVFTENSIKSLGERFK